MFNIVFCVKSAIKTERPTEAYDVDVGGAPL